MNQAQIEHSLTAYFADFTHPIIDGALRFHVKLDETANRWHIATNFNMVAGHEASVYTSFTAAEVDSRWVEALQSIESRLWDAIDYEEKQ